MSVFSVGAILDGAFGLLKREGNLTVECRRAFWGSRLGGWFMKVARVGLGPVGRRQELGNQDTELALGSAAQVLYDSLPKALRKQLAGLPAAIVRLERMAQHQRRRIEALQQLDADGSSRPAEKPGSEVLEHHRAMAAQEVRVARERAEVVLRDAVSALELFRIDLTRLHARGTNLTSITADLEAALEMSRNVQLETEAMDEVNSVSHGLRGTTND